METKVYQAHELHEKHIIAHIKSTIQKGGLIVFPTETVYGIGGNALSSQSAKHIFEAKGRPQDNPLIVHIKEKKVLDQYVKHKSVYAELLMDAFWPGPLTLIFDKNEKIPYEVTGGLETVAVRMPKHEVAQTLLNMLDVPLCAPSANISGKPSSTRFSHVLQDFNGKVDIMIDGGSSDIGLESTVLDLTQPIPTILRPGAITKKMIESVLKMPIIDGAIHLTTEKPKSPGMKYKHYAPKGRVHLLDGSIKDVICYINQAITEKKGHKIGVIGVKEVVASILGVYKVSLGEQDNLNEVGHNLFDALRQMDDLDIEDIYIHTFNQDDLGEAIMNRLSKASNYRVIKL